MTGVDVVLWLVKTPGTIVFSTLQGNALHYSNELHALLVDSGSTVFHLLEVSPGIYQHSCEKHTSREFVVNDRYIFAK